MSHYVDLAELKNVADGDQEFMKETIKLLLQEIPDNLENIDKYVSKKDIPSLKAIMHKMKSSFMLIGMQEIWPIIGEIEKSDSPETILALVPEFERICKESVEELKIMQNVI